MDADISSAADSLALQRIQAQDYRDASEAAAAAYAAERSATESRHVQNDAKTEAYRAADLALRQQHMAFMEREAAKLNTPDQERWLSMYKMHLAVRLGPAIITSTTKTEIILDMVNDATRMTVQAWPQVKAELDKLA